MTRLLEELSIIDALGLERAERLDRHYLKDTPTHGLSSLHMSTTRGLMQKKIECSFRMMELTRREAERDPQGYERGGPSGTAENLICELIE